MKKAFTLLELIVAIVVVAIAVLALPRIITASQRSNELALRQELIFYAKGQASYIMKFPWDSRALNSADICSTPISCGIFDRKTPIHQIAANGEATTTQRLGIKGSRRDWSGINITSPATGAVPADIGPTSKASFGTTKTVPEFADYLDVDDFDGANYNTTSAIDDGDFLTSTRVNINVNYVSDTLITPAGFACGNSYVNSENLCVVFDNGAAARPSNIKVIEVIATDTAETDYQAIIRAYVFNIGSLDLSL